ncbi:collagen alpha-1(XIV) chain-like [Penaeus chinensis]|uniref:collagen alpha-1(XIV) chain-like n=1 Tax=Penaeus chinensis TaxID=139456 RepID=UPI001FB72D58|nr:collagen alpha-1(XIV) chain-like [Penaeus chinensis]
MASCWFYVICVAFGLVVGVPVYDIKEEHQEPLLEVEVFNNYVIVRWTPKEWNNATDYKVQLANKSSSAEICEQEVQCDAIECEFTSNVNTTCELTPCTNITITVTGNNVTSTSDVVTAPAPKLEVGTKIIDNYLIVLWNETPETSYRECHVSTIVEATFARTGSITQIKESQVDRVLLPLSQCDTGAGKVRVISVGGNGSSEPKEATFNFEDSALVTPLVGSLELSATCDTIEATWELLDWCSYLAWFRVTLEPLGTVQATLDYNDTSAIFEGLDIGTNYEVCVLPVDSNGVELASNICSTTKTTIPAVEDLVAEAVNHTAIQVSWSPSECNMSEPLLYEIEVVACNNFTNETCSGKMFVNSTTELNYTQTGLEPHTEYHVSVITIYSSDSIYQTDDFVITLPMAPYDLQAFLQDPSTIYMSWDYLDDLAENQTYGLSWKLEGSDMIYSDTTTLKEYVIEGYNGTGTTLLCVTVTLDVTTSLPECNEFRLYYLEDDFGLILGLMLGIPLILFAIGLVLAQVFKIQLADVFPGV